MILFILGLLLFVFPGLEDTVKRKFRTKSCILKAAAELAGTDMGGQGSALNPSPLCIILPLPSWNPVFSHLYLSVLITCCSGNLRLMGKMWPSVSVQCRGSRSLLPLACFPIACSQYLFILSVEILVGNQPITVACTDLQINQDSCSIFCIQCTLQQLMFSKAICWDLHTNATVKETQICRTKLKKIHTICSAPVTKMSHLFPSPKVSL